MKRITLFSWGYWGWGNSVNKFIEATDAVEAARGYSPRFSPTFALGQASGRKDSTETPSKRSSALKGTSG